MKKIRFASILVLLILVSCTTTKDLYESGNYDEVIDQMLPKAKNNSLNVEQVAMLSQAYHKANEKDHESIMALKKSGEPDIWIEIYNRFSAIQKRQDKIKPLPKKLKTAIDFKPLRLDEELKTSKGKAELYLSAKAASLLKEPTEENVRQANVLIKQLQRIDSRNPSLGNLRRQAVISSAHRIIFRVAVPYNLVLTDQFAENVLNFEQNNINAVPFDVKINDTLDYDLMIRILVETAEISPERIDAVTFEEKKDGLAAIVTDKSLTKSAIIKGKIEYIDTSDETVLLSTPFDVTSTFKYNYAEVSGNSAACSEQTLILLQKKEIDFPSDEALLNDAGRKLNEIIEGAVF